MSSVQIITITEDRDGQRLDNFLMSQLKGVPKSWVYRVIRKGEVRVNKKRIKPLYNLRVGDQVRIPPVRTTAPKPAPDNIRPDFAEALTNAIIYEDPYFMIVNKPHGLAVHGGSGLSFGLIEAMRALKPEEHNLELVHRLDRDTSGCVMIAKKRSVLKKLQRLIQEKHIDKKYLCLVTGHWPEGADKVNAPLLKNQVQSGERLVKVDEEGKKSLTKFRLIKRFQAHTLMEAYPVTGRTHQIRVHCQYMRCPIIGDDKYCPDEVNKEARQLGFNRLFLHASSLTFEHPETSKTVSVKAPLGVELKAPLENLN